MKKNKTRIIVLSIIFILLCTFPIGFVYFSRGKYNDVKINDNENINLGDSGSCGKGTAYNVNPSCKNVTCSKYTSKTSCEGTYGCCSWKASSSCGAGNYTNSAGNCVSCPAGTYSGVGSNTSCTKCDPGTYSTGGARDCTQCRGFLNSSQTACYATCNDIPDSNTCNNASSCNWSNGKCSLSSCDPGYYSKENKCLPCPLGKSCAGGSEKPKECEDGYYSSKYGAEKCTKCDGGVVSSGKNRCITSCSSVTVRSTCNTIPVCNWDAKTGICVDNADGWCGAVTITPHPKVSPGQAIGVSVNYPKNIPTSVECKFDLTFSSDRGGTASGSVSIVGGVPRIKTPSKTYPACTIVTTTASGRGVIGTTEVETKFSDELVERPFDLDTSIPRTPTMANRDNKSYYGSESSCVVNSDGKRICQVHIRGKCNTSTAYSYCCVNNGTLELSTEAVPYEFVPLKSCPPNWTLLENVKPEDCKTETVENGSCNINNIPSPKQTGAADSCESTVSIKVDEGKQCTNTTENTTTNFYEISCAKTVKTGFDYGNDGKEDTIRTLYKGEGFGFGINVETSVNCKYTFFDTVWKAAYNKAKNKIQKIDSNLVQYAEKNQTEEWKTYINNNILNKNGITDVSILYDLWDTIENLQKVVNTYNEYLPSKNYKENGEITLTVNEKGKSVITKHKLISDVKEEGTYKSSEISTNKLGVPLLSDPKSYILSSNTPRKVLLIPKKVCIDKKGNFNTIEGTECPKNTIDGGNKIYTDMATDVTNGNTSYPISIKVEGLGSNDSSVTNDKCNLKIIESKYIYRPIDVSNPFISNSWQKGKNWVNETFDFTKVINKDTWQDNSKRKVITLTAKDIAAIKESNAKAWRDGNSPYLGLCISQEETLQYEITKKLCSIIK